MPSWRRCALSCWPAARPRRPICILRARSALALIPAAITGQVTLGGNLPPIFSVSTYMFLHGGWSHIIGNMLFLWVLGDNVEDAMGSVRFFFFYILCGAAGGLAHLFVYPDSV